MTIKEDAEFIESLMIESGNVYCPECTINPNWKIYHKLGNHIRNIKENRMEGLTEGRIVHYVDDEGNHCPALVVKVWYKETGCINLVYFTSDGLQHLATSRLPDEEKKSLSWHWIEKA